VSPQVTQAISNLTNYIRDAFITGASAQPWLSSTSRQNVIDKANNIIQIIGHPNTMNRYRGLVLDYESESFAQNLLSIRRV
jgi:predicted metalloendopeptidase